MFFFTKEGERRQKRALDVPIWETTEIRGNLDSTMIRNIATGIEIYG